MHFCWEFIGVTVIAPESCLYHVILDEVLILKGPADKIIIRYYSNGLLKERLFIDRIIERRDSLDHNMYSRDFVSV